MSLCREVALKLLSDLAKCSFVIVSSVSKHNELNATFSKDLDTALKKIWSVFAKPLTDLINISIKTGHFSDGWENALVKPVFKSGNLDEMINYRPIGLPVFSKSAGEGCIRTILASFRDE